MRIGAHVSAAGGIDRAIDRAVEMGAETIQIFGSPPQSLTPPKHSDESIELFRQKATKSRIEPIFLHAPYLVNIATPKESHRVVSVEALTLAMNLSSKLGAAGLIFHIGSALTGTFQEARNLVAKALEEILGKSPTDTRLIIENSAGGGGTVGDEPSEIGYFIKSLKDPRLATCLDTQHAFATGYDLSKKSGIDQLLSAMEEEIGLENLVALHANDSKVPLGSRRDRHENIGAGLIGKSGFREMKKNEVLAALPWIIEVPGFADKGPDMENLEILRSI